jgi:hypothetical protein
MISRSFANNTILLGDFNLDWKGLQNYAFKKYFDDMDIILNDLNLIQLVIFPTWSRRVLNEHRESIFDHQNTGNQTTMDNLQGISLDVHFQLLMC